MNCQNIDSQLLVKLIRLKKILNRPEPPASNTRPSIYFNQQSSRKLNIDKQVDISFPSLNHAPKIDMEIIEMKLNVENFKIEKILNESGNEYFRRVTIQLEQINGMNLSYVVHEHIVFFFFRC